MHVKRSYRTTPAKVIFSLALAAIVAMGLIGASSALAGGAVGTYEVQVQTGGSWTTVGAASFGLGYTSASVALPGDFEQVRLVQHGGTAAQIDAVSLSGVSPCAVAGSSDVAALAKVGAIDNDVTNVFGQAVDLTFPMAGSDLEITARIQGDISGAFPFEFPKANSYQQVGADSAFYSYRVRDLPTAIDTRAKPAIAEFCEPGTGHPAGTTYIWLANDGEHLLATVDFTPDNTMDGDEDYSAVHVKTPAGVKEFKISAARNRWGDVAFTYTDKVNYQHKLYTFAIPWSAIGAGSDEIDVSFTAYGTAAVPMPVFRFYNMKNGSHFYTASVAERDDVIANLDTTYKYEGVAYTVALFHPANKDPLFRFYSATLGTHFYTVSTAERDMVIAKLGETYKYEGVAYEVCIPDIPGSASIYRFYNMKNGSHFYTASVAERDAVLADLPATYAYEGVGFHVFE